jgi:hypothetical protein
MQTNPQIRPDLSLFNPEVVRRSLLKFGIAALAGACLSKTTLAMQVPVPQDVPDFLRHIDGHEPKRRHGKLICGTCFASLNLHRP